MATVVRWIPTAITLSSLISASSALIMLVLAPTSLTRDALVAACIAWSMAADGLDGPLARKLNAQTSLGAHLDSLADLTAFGIVPAMWLIARHGIEYGAVAIGLGILWVCAAAIRLARFAEDGVVPGPLGMSFKGVPTPVAAACVVTGVGLATVVQQPVIELVVLGAGVLLMPSSLPYPKAGIGRWPWVVLVPIAVAVLARHAAMTG
jgi:CDP-diacylglycerol--serine O-phosphatidyltransferase